MRSGPWIHVHVQVDRGHSVLDLMLHRLGDVVRLKKRGVWRAVDVHHRDQLPADPSRAYVVNTEHTLNARSGGGDLVDHVGIDSVHHAEHQAADRAGEDVNDGDRDRDARERIGDGDAEPRECESDEGAG